MDDMVSLDYTLSVERSYNGQKVTCIADNNATHILNTTATCEISINITCKFIILFINASTTHLQAFK